MVASKADLAARCHSRHRPGHPAWTSLATPPAYLFAVQLVAILLALVVLVSRHLAERRDWRRRYRAWWRSQVNDGKARILADIDSMPYATATDEDLARVIRRIDVQALRIDDATGRQVRDEYVDLLRRGAALRGKGGDLSQIASVRDSIATLDSRFGLYPRGASALHLLPDEQR